MNRKIRKIIPGIDLGTTNSCVAYKKEGEGGTVEVLINPEGSRTTPSVFALAKEGTLIGASAKRQASMNPEKTIFSVKRWMGTSKTFNLEGKDYRPEEISSKIIDYLMRKVVKEKLGEIGDSINEIVVTVPAYFSNNQRKATEDAVKIAGFSAARIINEPTAAALAYGFDKTDKNQTVLIYDLGGGTFDVSILNITKDKENGKEEAMFDVLSTSGINDLGGDDFNKKIIDYLREDFKKKNNFDLFDKEEKEKRIILQRLQEASEQAKHELSNKMESTISIPFITSNNGYPIHLNSSLTRSEFMRITDHYIKKTEEKVKDALKEASLKEEDIDQVILVGGSTRMPAVEDLVSKIFGKEKINKSVNPDEVVAVGAAIQGAILAGDIQNVVLLDVTPLSLGIEVEGGIMSVLIPRNRSIPTEATEVYSTAADNQTGVSIAIYEGERKRALDNKLLANFVLSDIEKAPRGVPQIEVSFKINSDSMLKVVAKDKKTGKEHAVNIDRGSYHLSKEEVEKMMREAEENREEDEKLEKNLENHNKASSYCHILEKRIADFDKNFNNDEDYRVLKKMYEELKDATERRDYEKINEQINNIDKLMEMANSLEERMPKESKENKNDDNNKNDDILDVENN